MMMMQNIEFEYIFQLEANSFFGYFVFLFFLSFDYDDDDDGKNWKMYQSFWVCEECVEMEKYLLLTQMINYPFRRLSLSRSLSIYIHTNLFASDFFVFFISSY